MPQTAPTYLSFPLVNGVPTATPTQTLDANCIFQQTGTVFAIGLNGYNVFVFGSAVPGGRVVFQRLPMFTPGWDAEAPGDFGILVPQPNGGVAIQWPM